MASISAISSSRAGSGQRRRAEAQPAELVQEPADRVGPGDARGQPLVGQRLPGKSPRPARSRSSSASDEGHVAGGGDESAGQPDRLSRPARAAAGAAPPTTGRGSPGPASRWAMAEKSSHTAPTLQVRARGWENAGSADQGPQHGPHRAERIVDPQRVGDLQQARAVLHDAGQPPGAVGVEGHDVGQGVGHDRHRAQVLDRADDLLPRRSSAWRSRSSSVSRKFHSRSAAAELSMREPQQPPVAVQRRGGAAARRSPARAAPRPAAPHTARPTRRA